MNIYLPIAEISVNVFLLLGMGGAVGFLSGLFGVGGGFLMTPLLIFVGIPPAVAVGSEASQILASSFSGVMAHMGPPRFVDSVEPWRSAASSVTSITTPRPPSWPTRAVRHSSASR
jgi:hypothetical protein